MVVSSNPCRSAAEQSPRRPPNWALSQQPCAVVIVNGDVHASNDGLANAAIEHWQATKPPPPPPLLLLMLLILVDLFGECWQVISARTGSIDGQEACDLVQHRSAQALITSHWRDFNKLPGPTEWRVHWTRTDRWTDGQWSVNGQQVTDVYPSALVARTHHNMLSSQKQAVNFAAGPSAYVRHVDIAACQILSCEAAD